MDTIKKQYKVTDSFQEWTLERGNFIVKKGEILTLTKRMLTWLIFSDSDNETVIVRMINRSKIQPIN